MKEFFLDLLILVVSIILLNVNKIVGSIFVAIFFINLILRFRPYYYIIKANRSYKANKKDEAISFYKKASSFKNCSYSIKIMYAFLLLKSGKLNEADNMLSNILNAKKTDAHDKYKAKMIYALVLWKKDKIDEAVKLLYEVYDQYKNISLYEILGTLLVVKGEAQKAVDFNKEAYDYDKGDTVIIDNFGKSYYLLGQYEKAMEMYKMLLEKKPEFPEAYYNYGLVLLSMGDKEKALENMEDALKYSFSYLSTVTKEEVENKISELNNSKVIEK